MDAATRGWAWAALLLAAGWLALACGTGRRAPDGDEATGRGASAQAGVRTEEATAAAAGAAGAASEVAEVDETKGAAEGAAEPGAAARRRGGGAAMGGAGGVGTAAPHPSPLAERMRRWYPVYRREVAPVRAALGRVIDGLAQGAQLPALDAPCRDLARALDGLDASGLFPAPDFGVDLHVKGAVVGLRRAASACLERRFFDLTAGLGQAEVSLTNAGLALRRYSQQP